jgi:hypothetical protein
MTMNKREFQTFPELEAFVNPMIAEKKWAIDIRQNTNTGAYLACWIEHKNYTSHDGQVYADEIWTTIDGDMKCVQDLEPEHAKNVLRLLLRNEREQRAMIQQALRAMAAEVADEEGEPEEAAPAATVHHHLH